MTTKADQAAAERLLKAAVKRAREVIAEGDVTTVNDWAGRVEFTYRHHDHAAVVAMLRAAGESAALLLGEAS